jgi:hypothetical protein
MGVSVPLEDRYAKFLQVLMEEKLLTDKLKTHFFGIPHSPLSSQTSDNVDSGLGQVL